LGLTVAITGPTGEIGMALLRELETVEAVESVRGMARRPFRPELHGWSKVAYRRGDVLDRDSLASLFEGADVVVHLAFSIFGGRGQTRRVNLIGSRNVFAAARKAGARRLVYASSVAAYGFHADNPQPLTEGISPSGSDDFYYSAQKAELEAALADSLDGSDVTAYVFRPCVVAGPQATMLIDRVVGGARLGDPLPKLRRWAGRVPGVKPILPDSGVPFQLVHHDDLAVALAAAIEGAGDPGAYNLAGTGTVTLGDVARSIGWRSVRVPGPLASLGGSFAQRLAFFSPQLEWAIAYDRPVLMDTAKARQELGWVPRFDAEETLIQTAIGAREAGILD
jgi:nucleoside-diphosphate-sugar epimerase